MMELKLERAGPAVVVRVERGTLAIDEEAAELHDLVRALTIFDPGCSVIMDLEKLHLLDCSGIGQLVQMKRQICDLGGVFVLLNVSARHRRLLEVLGLLRVVPVFATREEAVTACWSAQARGGAVRERWLEGVPRGARRPSTPRSQGPAAEV
jgi:stage II sporulation protein AA (anti-sigma F factor antagonist)